MLILALTFSACDKFGKTKVKPEKKEEKQKQQKVKDENRKVEAEPEDEEYNAPDEEEYVEKSADIADEYLVIVGEWGAREDAVERMRDLRDKRINGRIYDNSEGQFSVCVGRPTTYKKATWQQSLLERAGVKNSSLYSIKH